LIATPGRLLDLLNQGHLTFRDLEFVVLDEADQMLDMGFIHDIKKIIANLPPKRQSLFFSATMPKTIVELSKKILGEFEQVTIKPQQATAERVEQGVYFVSKGNKVNLLTELIKERPGESVLVFSRTKHGANKIVKKLDNADIKSAAIHGNKSQPQREAALGGFKEGKIQVLIATDIAARGIDVDQLSMVINYDLPNVPETYVHRIGRTGRASASGIALSFCENEERPFLRDIEKLINQKVPVMDPHPEVEEEIEDKNAAAKPKKPQQRGRGGGQRKPQQNRGTNSRRKVTSRD